jgi:hypothetical protein
VAKDSVAVAISSRTLFHFTNKADNLIGILTDDFLPRFCLEEFELFEVEGGASVFDTAIPMSCFCDLPLSNISEHLEFYGNYGIGLTKDWGIRQGLNPVMYISPQSDLNTHLLRVCNYALNSKSDSAVRDVADLLGFVKPVQGEMFRGGKMVPKYFYDEREWRFVPRLWDQIGDDNDDIRLTKEEFLNDVKRAHANRELRNQASLTFTPENVKYIIVSDESEIASMINAIRQIKRKFSKTEVDVLASRILSSHQIQQDF